LLILLASPRAKRSAKKGQQKKKKTKRAESSAASEVEILNYLCSCIALCSSVSLFFYCLPFSLFANFFDCFSSLGPLAVLPLLCFQYPLPKKRLEGVLEIT